MWCTILILVVVGCVAADEGRHRRQSTFSCASDETEILTPFYFAPTATTKCADLVAGITDFYNMDYRRQCQYWQGTASIPHQISASYVSHCTQLTNSTTRYRAKVCCPGATTQLRCFTCTNSSAMYNQYTDRTVWSNNYHTEQCNFFSGKVETCSAGEVCMTTALYGSRRSYGSYTKQCAAKSLCEQKKKDQKCYNGNFHPWCAYCCDTPYCNFRHPIQYRYKYVPVVRPIRTGCQRYHCYNGGTCKDDNSTSAGYICLCRPGYSGRQCHTNPCSTSPCKNTGRCWHYYRYAKPYYRCGCKAPWRGQNCEIACNLCTQNPCKNGGTCYDHLTFGTRCLCPDGFVGDLCDQKRPLKCSDANNYFLLSSSYNVANITRTCDQQMDYVERRFKRNYATTCYNRMSSQYKVKTRYLAGVHGSAVTEVDAISLNKCEKGDYALWYQYGVCCPACLSNPCQNGGWCQQTSDNSYSCKCRYGYGGNNCQYKQAICMAAGDPHYYTFDGKVVHFQGPCKYTFAQPIKSSTLPKFKVLVRNEHRNGGLAVTYNKYVELVVGTDTIRIDKGKVVTVNGVAVSAGATYAGFKVLKNGRFMRVETDFGVVVESDGDWIVTVKVPNEYATKMEGLCADLDGDKTNDMVTKEGKDVQNSPNKYSLFGNSWQVDDLSDPLCRGNTVDPPKCTATLLAKVSKKEYCGLLKDKDTQNPFKRCIDDSRSHASNYFDGCTYDLCANQNGNMKEIACKTLAAFASVCQELGHFADWRTYANCPLSCTTPATYKARTSACPASCAQPNAAKQCGLPDTESCVCPDGMLLEREKCIKSDDCGCVDGDGVRHEIGDTWLNDDCTESYTCTKCLTCQPVGQIITNSTEGCEDGSVCEINYGKYQCTEKGCKDSSGTEFKHGDKWTSSDCTTEYTCDGGSIKEKKLPACQRNQQCALLSPNNYGCVINGCVDPMSSIVYKIGDTWLNKDCTQRLICKRDGSISSGSNKCTKYNSCQLKGGIYVCAPIVCKDEKGGIRKLFSTWTSANCKYRITCAESGIDTTPTAGCRGLEKCRPGDLGKCEIPPGTWSTWSSWSSCSGRCYTGDQQRSRKCLPAGTQCKGVAVETRQCVCINNFNSKDCDKCHFVTDVLGYLPAPCDCNSFIQCVKVNGKWVAHNMPCAPCTEWDQQKVTCVHSPEPCTPDSNIDNQVGQQGDICIRSGNAKKKQHPTDDKKYLWLVNNKWLTRSCAPGTIFSKLKCDCIHDPNYISGLISPVLITCIGFERNVLGSNGIYASANDGVTYTSNSIFGTGVVFNGNGRIEIPFFKNRIDYSHFSVSLWYERTGFGSGLQGLLSNGDCLETASVEILSESKTTVSGMIDTENGKAKKSGILVTSGDWHHVVLVYTGVRLNVYVDSKLYSTTATVGGKIIQRYCPMMLGTSGPGTGFTGIMDNVCFYESALSAIQVKGLYQQLSTKG